MLQTQLKMDRLDLAKKELKTMQEIDDDAVVTQLASAWVNLLCVSCNLVTIHFIFFLSSYLKVCSLFLLQGGDKLQEAYYTFQELADKNTTTALLLNGQATCYIGQGKYEEADHALQEALEKDSNNTDTLVNMVVLCQLSGKAPEVCNRYLNQLTDSAPDHYLVKEMQAKERDFNSIAKMYTACA